MIGTVGSDEKAEQARAHGCDHPIVYTREDFPKPDPEWGKRNVVVRQRDGRLELATEPIPSVPDELRGLIGEDKPTGQVATGAPAAVGGTS